MCLDTHGIWRIKLLDSTNWKVRTMKMKHTVIVMNNGVSDDVKGTSHQQCSVIKLINIKYLAMLNELPY